MYIGKLVAAHVRSSGGGSVSIAGVRQADAADFVRQTASRTPSSSRTLEVSESTDHEEEA
jgi:hypothetical protein